MLLATVPRGTLVLVGVALCVLLAGCLGGLSADRGSSSSLEDRVRAADDGPPGSHHTPAPGNATPLTIRKTIDPDSIGYDASNDTVRFATGMRHVNHAAMQNGSPPTREPTYDRVPFDRWALAECSKSGAEAVRAHLQETFRADYTDGLTVGGTMVAGSVEIIVRLKTVLDRGGDVVSTPTVDYGAVRNATPARVDATIVVGDREYACETPVRVEAVVARYD